MSYATPSDVASLNKARVFGVGNNPTVTDVTGYCTMVAGTIDSVLLSKGYSVPVNTASYPEAAGLLQWINATGAWVMMEEASPNSVNVDRAKAAYDAAIKMLSDAKFVMDLPMNTARADVRAPWVTFQPTGQTYDPTFGGGGNAAGGDGISGGGGNNPANPFFSRQLRF